MSFIILIFLLVLLISFLSLLALIPAALPIYIAYKITKNYEEKKKNIINSFSIAFSIPFVNFIYLLFLETCKGGYGIYPLIIGYFWLSIILPVFLFIFLLIPKKRFVHKKFFLLTILLTVIFECFFVAISTFGLDLKYTYQEFKELNEYRPIINYIEQYKKQNGVYPRALRKDLIVPKNYTYYQYETFNNNQDFKLNVSDYATVSYTYCSNKKLNGCDKHSKSLPFMHRYKQEEKWIIEDID